MAPSMDSVFHTRLVQARGNEIFELIKALPRRPPVAKVAACAHALGLSKSHRTIIERYLADFCDRRLAVQAIMAVTPTMSPSQAWRPLLLLCKLRHGEALAALIASGLALPASEHVPFRQAFNLLMANHAIRLRKHIIDIATGSDLQSSLFISRWAFNIDQHQTVIALQRIALSDVAPLDLRGKATIAFTVFAPRQAMDLLTSQLLTCSVAEALTAIQKLLMASEPEAHDWMLRRLHSEATGGLSVAAATYLAMGNDRSCVEVLDVWLRSQLPDAQNASDVLVRDDVAHVVAAIHQAGDARWAPQIEEWLRDPQVRERIRRALILGRTECGFQLLLEEIRAAETNGMFRPVVDALRNYGKRAVEVVELVLQRGDTRLMKRTAEIADQIWPGRSLESLVHTAERAPADEVPATSVKPAPTESDRVPRLNQPQRKQRLTSSFQRDQDVVDLVKGVEDGVCQTCGRCLTDFRSGAPYSEAHHIRPLSHDGPDDQSNVLCLCPLCHRLFHLGAIGITAAGDILKAADLNETVLPRLRTAAGRSLDPDCILYHWSVFFVKPPEAVFMRDELTEMIFLKGT